MIENYTKETDKRVHSLIESDIEEVWKDIEQMPEDTNAEKWKKKLKLLAEEFTFSSRFALMRIFLDRADSSQLIDTTNPSCGFVAILSDGTEFALKDVTIEHAKQSTSEEMLLLEKFLLEQASMQSDYDAVTDSIIIKKAISPCQNKTTFLTRDEAFMLGHMLKFTRDEMEWFLLRVFDTDDGFAYNTSNDLIEAYGFLSEISSKEVAELKRQYKILYENVPKIDFEEKDNNWTKDTTESLSDKVQAWKTYNRDTQNARFIHWLGEKAPYLDNPSKTALRIYRNLAVYTHKLAIRETLPPNVDDRGVQNKSDFVKCVEQIILQNDYAAQTEEALFENGRISPAKCKNIADTLLFENWIFAFCDQLDKAKAWHVIQVMTDGRMTVSGGVNKSRKRVESVLSGKIERIEKSDMLYLLWFMSNLCWFDGKERLNSTDISNRLKDFIDVSALCLQKAGLPKFYPPHLVEQSMMLSIVCAFRGAERCDPAEVYEQICSTVIEHKAKKAAGEKKDSPNRIALLRRELKLNQTQLAEMLGITQTYVSAWERGKSEPSETYKRQLANLFGTSVDFLMGHDE